MFKITQEEEEFLCSVCGDPATWMYMPGDGYWSGKCACDLHVPRGCSCNMEPIDGNDDNRDPDNWKQILDDQGRECPCIEWWPLGGEEDEEEYDELSIY